MNIEEILEHIGGFGRFQKWIFFAGCLTSFSAGAQMVLNIFSGAKPNDADMYCKSNSTLQACDSQCEEIGFNETFKSYATEVHVIK